MVENLWLNHYIKQPHDMAGSSLGKTFVTILDFSGQHIKVDFITTIINPLSGKSYSSISLGSISGNLSCSFVWNIFD